MTHRLARSLMAIALTALMTTMAASAEVIEKIKKNKIKLYDSSGSLIEKLEATPDVRRALVGAQVEYHSATGMYRMRLKNGDVYLSSRDVKVSNGVGESGATLCARLKGTGFQNGSNGSGAGCQ